MLWSAFCLDYACFKLYFKPVAMIIIYCGFMPFSGGQLSLWWLRITQAMIRIIVPVLFSSNLGQSELIGMEIEAAAGQQGAEEDNYKVLHPQSQSLSHSNLHILEGLDA